MEIPIKLPVQSKRSWIRQNKKVLIALYVSGLNYEEIIKEIGEHAHFSLSLGELSTFLDPRSLDLDDQIKRLVNLKKRNQ